MSLKIAVVILASGALLLQTRSQELNEIPRGLHAKNLLTSLASDLMSRGFATTASGGSQVVSLNLTNLLVLVLLKALIFAAGSLGSGVWKGRSTPDEDLLTENEILLFLTYLTNSPGCLQNVSCKQPQEAKQYAAAGDILLKTAKMMRFNPPPGRYERLLQDVEEAADVGLAAGNCATFSCGLENDKYA